MKRNQSKEIRIWSNNTSIGKLKEASMGIWWSWVWWIWWIWTEG